MIVKIFAAQILVTEVLADGKLDSFFSSLATPTGVFCGLTAGQLLCSPSQSSGVSQGLASRLATKDWEHGESHMAKTEWMQNMF